jgi:hypothetical protein
LFKTLLKIGVLDLKRESYELIPDCSFGGNIAAACLQKVVAFLFLAVGIVN